ncbi:MAG: thiamine-phosphate pyrophosphorylase [Myxococcota bacterium]|jgi:thiamine-phosphate pyrophosphorylase
MRPALPAGLYGMADAGFGDPVALGCMLAEAGCRVIQLRAKGWSEADLRAAAAALLPPLRARGCLLILNDHPALAAAVGADGAHIGQDDGRAAEARAMLGPARLLGLSTHTPQQVDAAQGVADYIGFGPVFGTQTKATGYAPRGVGALAEAATRSAIPVVAIGGITTANLPDVRGSGAHCWAVVSAILRAPSPPEAVRLFLSIE